MQVVFEQLSSESGERGAKTWRTTDWKKWCLGSRLAVQAWEAGNVMNHAGSGLAGYIVGLNAALGGEVTAEHYTRFTQPPTDGQV